MEATRAFPLSIFWSLTVCKNEEGRPGRSRQMNEVNVYRGRQRGGRRVTNNFEAFLVASVQTLESQLFVKLKTYHLLSRTIVIFQFGKPSPSNFWSCAGCHLIRVENWPPVLQAILKNYFVWVSASDSRKIHSTIQEMLLSKHLRKLLGQYMWLIVAIKPRARPGAKTLNYAWRLTFGFCKLPQLQTRLAARRR